MKGSGVSGLGVWPQEGGAMLRGVSLSQGGDVASVGSLPAWGVVSVGGGCGHMGGQAHAG